jgi:hypothetical protein
VSALHYVLTSVGAGEDLFEGLAAHDDPAVLATRSRVLSFEASCRVTRSRLRDAARWASVVNGASTMQHLALGGDARDDLTHHFRLGLTSESKFSMTAMSPAGRAVEQGAAEREGASPCR